MDHAGGDRGEDGLSRGRGFDVGVSGWEWWRRVGMGLDRIGEAWSGALSRHRVCEGHCRVCNHAAVIQCLCRSAWADVALLLVTEKALCAEFRTLGR